MMKTTNPILMIVLIIGFILLAIILNKDKVSCEIMKGGDYIQSYAGEKPCDNIYECKERLHMVCVDKKKEDTFLLESNKRG